MRRIAILLALSSIVLGTTATSAADGNRLAYLDGDDPYAVGLGFPKLITPQWIGEEGVEAVVVLAVDDMTDNVPKYEAFLRPILDRLKTIDGRAPVSIMTCRVDPNAPQLQGWLKEGVNVDAHTLTHPCPLLQKGDFAEAKRAYQGCVDLLNKIPNQRPVAFRMPCCDSRNTVSPRFYAQIFNDRSPDGHFLTIDSSIFNITTPNDPELPRALVLDTDGRERFRKYLPFASFVNTIEDYPYPYVIGRLCWEFPCIVPSDWEAQNLNKPNHPRTVEDLKAALDAVVIKQGVFNLVFHPHGWIKSEQVVELIDHAVKTHGKKVKFLNFREAQERIDKNLLGGQPLRAPDGSDNGVRLIDLDHDGLMDVVIGNPAARQTRLWDSKTRTWKVMDFPVAIRGRHAPAIPVDGVTGGLHFGVVRPGGEASMLIRDKDLKGGWHFDGRSWTEDPALLAGLELDGQPIETSQEGVDRGVRLRDLDGDGRCELLVGNVDQNACFRWSDEADRWIRLPFGLPTGTRVVDIDYQDYQFEDEEWLGSQGYDAGLRFIDLDEDGHDDVVFSNQWSFGVYLFDSLKTGWSRRVVAGKRTPEASIPPIIRTDEKTLDTNNGFWVHSRQLWWQNEDTAALPDLVDRRSFNDLLKDVEPRGKSPEASLRSIRVRPGFTAELVVSEPLVMDPVAFDWGVDGKLWVVEMGDYPLGVDGKGKPGGIVRFLEDIDGDGRYDKSTIFLEGLSFPNGILPWRKGVLVSCAPEIFYAEDRDGDGKADVRQTLFRGFLESNPQHRANGFDYGLDNWVYGADGDADGTIVSARTGRAIAFRGSDFRFRPDDGRFEPESGRAQFGRHRDDWGNWFGNNNSVWAWHDVLSNHDLARNPQVAVPDPRQILDPDGRLFPISRTLARFNEPESANRITSANSPTPYRDDLFGPGFARSLFVSEPVHNLVRRVVLEPDGPTFRGHRAADEADREFLASTDHWFRPTMLKTGPDGALWIADMYRAVIEHPEWIPDDWEAKLDLRAGHEMGRIYRVFPVDRRPRPIPRLDRLDTAGLVVALETPSGWQRDNAQRLLIQAGDRSAIEPLRRLATKGSRPQTRVQAIWTLAGLVGLNGADLSAALNDADPEVRRHAIRAFDLTHDVNPPNNGIQVARRADDPDVRVRFQVALSLGDCAHSEEAGPALATVLRRDPDDPWIRAAVLSSSGPHAGAILASLFAGDQTKPPPAAVIEPLFKVAASSPNAKGLAPLIDVVATPGGPGGEPADWQFAALAGLLDAADRAEGPLAKRAEADPELRRARGRLAAVFAAARKVAEEDQAPLDRRVAAVRLLGREGADPGDDVARLGRLLRPQAPAPVQSTAVATLGRLRDDRVADVLLADWQGYTPQLRGAIVDVLLSREGWVPKLLSALEMQRVSAAEFDLTRRRRLLDLPDPALRARASKLFDRPTEGRREVVDAYLAKTKGPGDPKAGAVVFKKVCASCHRLAGEGVEVGPDLAALTDKSREALLIAILDPNRAFESKYAGFTVQTTDGRVLTGLVAAETANSVTLRRQEGQSDVLLRSDIDAMAGSGRSLMPEGLEKDLSPDSLADLIAFLRASRPPHKEVAGNRPMPVGPGPGGTIALKAETAEIFGDSLTFETKYGNLGFWSAANDQAAWDFDVERPGRYEVWLDWACDVVNRGNTYALDFDQARLEGSVPTTGSWDEYRSAKVGEIQLAVGRHRLEVRPIGPIRGALMDLRTVELRPLPPDARER